MIISARTSLDNSATVQRRYLYAAICSRF